MCRPNALWLVLFVTWLSASAGWGDQNSARSMSSCLFAARFDDCVSDDRSAAWGSQTQDDIKKWAEYHNKIAKLQQKRMKDRRKVERKYQKLLQEQKPEDAEKIQKSQREFRNKLRQIDEEYYRELLKLERKQWGQRFDF